MSYKLHETYTELSFMSENCAGIEHYLSLSMKHYVTNLEL